MGKKGWLTVRNIPVDEGTSKVSPVIYKILKNFFKNHRVCKNCGGLGYTISDKKIEVLGMAIVKFEGIAEFEILKKNQVKLSDVIREIIESHYRNRKPCSRCNGSRFIGVKKNVKVKTNTAKATRSKSKTLVRKKLY